MCRYAFIRRERGVGEIRNIYLCIFMCTTFWCVLSLALALLPTAVSFFFSVRKNICMQSHAHQYSCSLSHLASHLISMHYTKIMLLDLIWYFIWFSVFTEESHSNDITFYKYNLSNWVSLQTHKNYTKTEVVHLQWFHVAHCASHIRVRFDAYSYFHSILAALAVAAVEKNKRKSKFVWLACVGRCVYLKIIASDSYL